MGCWSHAILGQTRPGVECRSAHHQTVGIDLGEIAAMVGTHSNWRATGLSGLLYQELGVERLVCLRRNGAGDNEGTV